MSIGDRIFYSAWILLFICFVVVFALLPFFVCYRVFCDPHYSEVLITDTGDSIPYNSDTCSIIESTKTIVVKQDGSLVSYSYNDWYYIDTIELPSYWDRFVDWLRPKICEVLLYEK